MIHKKITLFLTAVLMTQSLSVHAESPTNYLNTQNGIVAFITLAALGTAFTAYRYITKPVIKKSDNQEFDSKSSVVAIVEPTQEKRTQPQDEQVVPLATEEANESVVPEAEEITPRLLVTIQVTPLYDKASGSCDAYMQ